MLPAAAAAAARLRGARMADADRALAHAHLRRGHALLHLGCVLRELRAALGEARRLHRRLLRHRRTALDDRHAPRLGDRTVRRGFHPGAHYASMVNEALR